MASYSDTSAQNALIDRVEFRADQVTATNQTIGLNAEATYDELDEAGLEILRKAPRSILYETASDGSTATVANENGYTEIVCPDDFIRFLSLELAEWNRRVYNMIDPRADRIRMAYNSKTSPDKRNPACALVSDPAQGQGQILHAWPQDSTPSISHFSYIAPTAPENMPTELVDALLWQATGRVLQSQKEGGSGAAYEKASQVLSQLRVGEEALYRRPVDDE